MKKQWLLLMLAATLCYWSEAQTTFYENFKTKAGQSLRFDLDKGKEVQVECWDKDEVQIEVVLKMDQEIPKDFFEFHIQESSDEILIGAHIDHKKLPRQSVENGVDLEEGASIYSININGGETWVIYNVEMTYKIKVPRKNPLAINACGDIEIKNASQELDIVSTGGFVDVEYGAAAGGNVELATRQGEIYSDFDLVNEIEEEEETKGECSCKGKTTIKSKLNGKSGVPIRLESSCGNIYFRKKGGKSRI